MSPNGIRQAVILAGGRGKRLQPVISHLAKPMAPIGGRPFVEYILDKLVDGGIGEFIFSVGYRAETIQAHFGDFYRAVPVRYSWEDIPLGTGGAIARALENGGASPVLIVNGDSLLEANYRALADWAGTVGSSVGVVLCHVPDVTRYGSVMVSEGRVVEFSEKGRNGPGLINAGIYILRPDIFSLYPCGKQFSFESDFLQRYCHELEPQYFVADGYFIDIGTPEDYARAQRELGAGCIGDKARGNPSKEEKQRQPFGEKLEL